MVEKEDEQYWFGQGDAFLFPTRYVYDLEGGAIYDAGLPAFTVCEAFAAEAYLKSLIKIESGTPAPRTHNLRKLFGLLRPETQEAIREAWVQKHAWGVLNVPHGNAPDGTPYEMKVPETFEEALELSAEAFLKWRYDFRDHHGWHMRALGYLVRREILNVRPEWKPEAGSYYSRLDPHSDFVKHEPQVASSAPAAGPKLSYRTPTFKFQMRRGAKPDDSGAR